MALKWTGSNSESGILRKSEFKEKKEELFVFGYSCKLFRDDDKAQHIDQGKHLIPWMGDETLKIDRGFYNRVLFGAGSVPVISGHIVNSYGDIRQWYDARGALHDLSRLEAPPGGYDWRVELTRGEQDVELLCDEERYRALHTDEDEEEMYKEEELKRLHAAGYGQVSFNYDAPTDPSPSQPAEADEPFEPSDEFKALLSPDVVLPDGVKQNAIIEKTAIFIERKGPQMEILIKAKQQDNPQFQFLNKDSSLHAYYTALIGLVKTGKWPEKKVEPVVEEEKPPENEDYLHPSLSTVIESAPSIPSIHYKPSADCDYTMLISKMRGEPILDEAFPPVLAPGEVAPPGTEPLPPRANTEISRAPVMYNQGQGDPATQTQAHLAHYQQYTAYYQQYMTQQQQTQPQPQSQPQPQPQIQPQVVEKNDGPVKSTGLSLMKNYNTDSDSYSDTDDSSSTTASKGKPAILVPPDDVKVVIDKMAAYVARNGDDFENIVRAKNDPRFMFLEPENQYHAFYRKLMQDKRGGDVNGKEKDSKSAPTVCFSIKKHKEPEPILPKPALPYESSSDEESEEKNTKQAAEQPPQTNIPPVVTTTNSIPPVLVYKMEASQVNNLPVVKTIEAKPTVHIVNNFVNTPPIEYKEPAKELPPSPKVAEQNNKTPEMKKFISPPRVVDEKYKEEEYRKEKKRHKEKKKERERDRKIDKETRKSERRSVDREREKRDRVLERDKRDRHEKRKYNKEELDTEIIELEESEEFIDLTGDMPEPKGETEADRQRKLERRQRAAEFLRRAGVEPSTLPASSLGSAMVDTLETIRRKKEQEEDKRRRRDKKRQKERRAYDDEYEKYHRKSKRRKNSDDESDYDCSKRKKRKKDKKSSKSKKKRAHNDIDPDAENDPQITIDISSTLKELRSATPTNDLVNDLEDTQHSFVTRRDTSSDSEEEIVRRHKKSREESEKWKKQKKKPREYSEGEWSSDSEDDSESSVGKYD